MAKNIVKNLHKAIKEKACRECEEMFTPYNSLQVCCSSPCAIEYAKKKVWKQEKAKRIDKLRTRTEWLNLLQVVFNTYIRLRDKDRNLPCVSCGCIIKNGHASHFFSVGSYPNLRFNEDNVHTSCIECNLHKHGNTAEYAIRLPNRIGNFKFNRLVSEKDKPLKLSESEIKELIATYKAKIKSLKC